VDSLISSNIVFWGLAGGFVLVVLGFGFMLYRMGVAGTQAGVDQATYWADVLADVLTSAGVDEVLERMEVRAKATPTSLDDMTVETLLAVQKQLEAHLEKRKAASGAPVETDIIP